MLKRKNSPPKCKICGSKLKVIFQNLFDDRHGYPGQFQILNCVSCGFKQTYPSLNLKQLSGLYVRYYPKRDLNINEIIKNADKIPDKKTVFRNGLGTNCHYQTQKNQKVLDVGCGSCQSLLEIKKLGGAAWGIDVDRNSQSVAKKLKLNFCLGTIHDFKGRQGSFDLITASQVIEHDPQPIEFLKKCRKLLNQNGKIIISFPSTDSLGFKIWRKKWLHWHLPYHLNHFNKTSVELMVKKAGLKISSLKTVTPNLWTLLQIKSYLNHIQPGERDIMWDGDPRTKGSAGKIYSKLNLANKFLYLNRIIDFLGLGESFVITLVRPGERDKLS